MHVICNIGSSYSRISFSNKFYLRNREQLFNILLVKNLNSVGTVVYSLNDSKEVDMIDDLLKYKLKGKDKQIVLLSNLEMWKEYELFNIINSVEEFIDKAILN
ncbi:DUF6718 family protein [Clostridium sp. Marseille-Q7071]